MRNKNFLKASAFVLSLVFISTVFVFGASVDDRNFVGKYYTLDRYVENPFKGEVISVLDDGKGSYEVVVEIENLSEDILAINELSLSVNCKSDGTILFGLYHEGDFRFGLESGEKGRFSTKIPKGVKFEKEDEDLLRVSVSARYQFFGLRVSENSLMFPKQSGSTNIHEINGKLGGKIESLKEIFINK